MKYHVGEEETKPEKEDFYSLILLLQQEYTLLNLKTKCFTSYQNFVRIKYGRGMLCDGLQVFRGSYPMSK